MILPKRNFRVIPQLDQYEFLVSFCQTLLGKIFLMMCFGATTYFAGWGFWLELTLLLTILTLLPQFRRGLLVAATFYWTVFQAPFMDPRVLARKLELSANGTLVLAGMIILVFLFCGAYLHMAKSKRVPWLSKMPLRSLFIGYFLAITIFSLVAPLGRWYWVIFVFFALMAKYIWYLAYSILDRHAKESPSFVTQLGHYFPFWQSSFAQIGVEPMGKGASYLRRVESKDSRELAVCQLKGYKLLLWCLLLTALQQVLIRHLYGNVSIPYIGDLSVSLRDFSEALQLTSEDMTPPWYEQWVSLITTFLMQILEFSIWGHKIIALCRMAGFKALRNTYKPFQSQTLIEFFNRLMFYFKELLVDVFFYPTFFLCFKRSPRLRIMFAILMAAGVGNFLFHFIEPFDLLMRRGIFEHFLYFLPYLVFCLILGVSLGVSQLRKQRRKTVHHSWLRRKIGNPSFVLLFYCLLSAFEPPAYTSTLGEHFSFFLSLFGIQL